MLGWEGAWVLLCLPSRCLEFAQDMEASIKGLQFIFVCARLKLHTPSGVLLGTWPCPLEEAWGTQGWHAHTHPGPQLALWLHHTLALAGHSGHTTESIPCPLTSDATSSLMTMLLILPRSWAREVRVVVAVATFSTDRAQSSRSSSQVVSPSLLGPENRLFRGIWG